MFSHLNILKEKQDSIYLEKSTLNPREADLDIIGEVENDETDNNLV